ncbi:MAG: hypothetical protein FJ109_03115 [Deltaproteobacteria bacterium]|nr:hypothetical protein [Deltaproteobacteria bacterium]
MSDKEFEVEEGQEVVRKTIVGGRPRARRTHRIKIPIGIEKVLCRAAADSQFRRILFEDRPRALQAYGQDLSDTEREVLHGIPAPMLQEMVGRIDLKQHGKSRLMRGVLAAAMLVSTAMVDTGCFEVQTAGISPDDFDWAGQDAVVEVGESMDLTGMEPDSISDDLVEPDVITVEDTMATKGILPDPDVR